jgi:hypothetical protein
VGHRRRPWEGLVWGFDGGRLRSRSCCQCGETRANRAWPAPLHDDPEVPGLGAAAQTPAPSHSFPRSPYNSGQNHQEATALLRRVHPDGPALAADLAQLLAMKTKAGYTHRPVTSQERTQAGRRAQTLVDAARALPLRLSD